LGRRTVLRRVLSAGWRRYGFWLHRVWPWELKRPVFVVGCPRSGTTVFGRILAQAPRICYLHEPRHIWCRVEPRLDVWAYRGAIGRNRLYWDERDVDMRQATRLAHLFHMQLWAHRRERLVEKLPLNVFRIRWLAAMFPEAKYVHVVRHARDVALSLETAVRNWFPDGYWESSRHYGIFRDYARSRPVLAGKLGLISEASANYPRGLLVWACAVTAGREGALAVGPHRYLSVRYEEVVRSPREVLTGVFEFIGEPLPEAVLEYASEVLHRRSVGKPDPQPQLTRAIAEDMLPTLGYGG
jgi:hypothetical protein